jgi:hypothetical protein
MTRGKIEDDENASRFKLTSTVVLWENVQGILCPHVYPCFMGLERILYSVENRTK